MRVPPATVKSASGRRLEGMKEAAAILTHLPDRLDQSADYLRGFPAASVRRS